MRTSWVLLSIFIFTLVSSNPARAVFPNTDADAFKKSLELYSKNNFSGSIKILIQLLRRQPKNSLYWFNLGNSYFMARSYKYAAVSFEKVISLQSPLSPAAKLYKAKALDKLGQQAEARVMLEQVLHENPPAGIAQEAKKDLEAILLASYKHEKYAETEKALREMGPDLSPEGRMLLGMSLAKQNKNSQAERVFKGLASGSGGNGENQALARSLLENLSEEVTPYWVYVDFAYGSADNVFMDGRSLTPLTSPLVRAQLEAGYHFNKNRTWSEKLVYAYNNESLSEATEMGTQSHMLLSSLLYQGSAWTASVTPYFQNDVWASTTVGQKTGASTEVAYAFGKPNTIGMEVRGESQQAKTETYSYLTGTSYFLRPYYETGFKYFAIQFQWLMGADGTQDIVYSDGSRLPLTQTYQGPGMRMQWSPTEKTLLGLSLSRIERVYKNISLPESKKRSDQELNGALKFMYSFSSQWRAYALVEYIANKSTLGAGDVRDKNYSATTSTIGMSWDVF